MQFHLLVVAQNGQSHGVADWLLLAHAKMEGIMRTSKLLVTLSAAVMLGLVTQDVWAQANNIARVGEVRAQFDAYNAAFAAGDADALATWYVDHAVRIPPDDPMKTGVAAIQAGLATFFADIDYVLDDVTADDVQAAGNLAVIRATFREHWTPKAGGDTTQQTGRWITVWGRQPDGTWKITMDMWTVQQPE